MVLSKTCGIRTLKQVDTLPTSSSFIKPVSTSAYNLIKPSAVKSKACPCDQGFAPGDYYRRARVEKALLLKAVIYHRLSQSR